MAKLMSETSEKCNPKTCAGSPNAISSPALGSGITLFAEPDGQTILPFGQGVAHASHSVRAGSGEASQISVICGPHGSGSSESVGLTFALASRLRPVTDSLGSTLFRLIWKVRATPSGRRICALRASGRRTSGRDFTSWPTPQIVESPTKMHRERSDGGQPTLGWIADLAAWPTPTKGNADGSETGRRTMNETAKLAAWPTPQSHDERDRGNTEADHHYFPHDLSNAAILASWATPRSTDGEKGGPNQHGSKGDLMLPSQASLTASGPTPNGSTAETRNTGQLNPAHSRWLQGLPPEWDACAVTATRSARRSRKPS